MPQPVQKTSPYQNTYAQSQIASDYQGQSIQIMKPLQNQEKIALSHRQFGNQGPLTLKELGASLVKRYEDGSDYLNDKKQYNSLTASPRENLIKYLSPRKRQAIKDNGSRRKAFHQIKELLHLRKEQKYSQKVPLSYLRGNMNSFQVDGSIKKVSHAQTHNRYNSLHADFEQQQELDYSSQIREMTTFSNERLKLMELENRSAKNSDKKKQQKLAYRASLIQQSPYHQDYAKTHLDSFLQNRNSQIQRLQQEGQAIGIEKSKQLNDKLKANNKNLLSNNDQKLTSRETIALHINHPNATQPNLSQLEHQTQLQSPEKQYQNQELQLGLSPTTLEYNESPLNQKVHPLNRNQSISSYEESPAAADRTNSQPELFSQEFQKKDSSLEVQDAIIKIHQRDHIKIVQTEVDDQIDKSASSFNEKSTSSIQGPQVQSGLSPIKKEQKQTTPQNQLPLKRYATKQFTNQESFLLPEQSMSPSLEQRQQRLSLLISQELNRDLHQAANKKSPDRRLSYSPGANTTALARFHRSVTTRYARQAQEERELYRIIEERGSSLKGLQPKDIENDSQFETLQRKTNESRQPPRAKQSSNIMGLRAGILAESKEQPPLQSKLVRFQTSWQTSSVGVGTDEDEARAKGAETERLGEKKISYKDPLLVEKVIRQSKKSDQIRVKTLFSFNFSLPKIKDSNQKLSHADFIIKKNIHRNQSIDEKQNTGSMLQLVELQKQLTRRDQSVRQSFVKSEVNDNKQSKDNQGSSFDYFANNTVHEAKERQKGSSKLEGHLRKSLVIQNNLLKLQEKQQRGNQQSKYYQILKDRMNQREFLFGNPYRKKDPGLQLSPNQSGEIEEQELERLSKNLQRYLQEHEGAYSDQVNQFLNSQTNLLLKQGKKVLNTKVSKLSELVQSQDKQLQNSQDMGQIGESRRNQIQTRTPSRRINHRSRGQQSHASKSGQSTEGFASRGGLGELGESVAEEQQEFAAQILNRNLVAIDRFKYNQTPQEKHQADMKLMSEKISNIKSKEGKFIIDTSTVEQNRVMQVLLRGLDEEKKQQYLQGQLGGSRIQTGEHIIKSHTAANAHRFTNSQLRLQSAGIYQPDEIRDTKHFLKLLSSSVPGQDSADVGSSIRLQSQNEGPEGDLSGTMIELSEFLQNKKRLQDQPLESSYFSKRVSSQPHSTSKAQDKNRY